MKHTYHKKRCLKFIKISILKSMLNTSRRTCDTNSPGKVLLPWKWKLFGFGLRFLKTFIETRFSQRVCVLCTNCLHFQFQKLKCWKDTIQTKESNYSKLIWSADCLIICDRNQHRNQIIWFWSRSDNFLFGSYLHAS